MTGRTCHCQVFEKTQVSCALQADDLQTQAMPVANQLILFDF